MIINFNGDLVSFIYYILLQEVLIHCGGDQLNAPFAWPHLENVDFSYNGIELLDDSVVCKNKFLN